MISNQKCRPLAKNTANRVLYKLLSASPLKEKLSDNIHFQIVLMPNYLKNLVAQLTG